MRVVRRMVEDRSNVKAADGTASRNAAADEKMSRVALLKDNATNVNSPTSGSGPDNE